MAQTSSTITPEKKDYLTVSGYIRKIDVFIPKSITNLCFEFYYILREEWDKKLAKGLYKINDKNEIKNIYKIGN